MTELIDDPKRIDTYEKIIGCIKRDLIDYITEPTDQNASELYASMGSIPFKYKEYKNDVWDEYISESREYMSMLFQLFADYFQEFIKRGKWIDTHVKEHVLKNDTI